MSLAAFLGGGERQKGQGLLGRAVAIADENRAHDKKMNQIALEEGLKNQNKKAPMFAFQAANSFDPSNPITFSYQIDPRFHDKLDAGERAIHAREIMNKFSALPDKVKDEIWKDKDAKNQIMGIVGIIETEFYKVNKSQDGTVGSFTGINNLKTYQDPWSYTNIWKEKDNTNIGFTRDTQDAPSLLDALGIQTQTAKTENGSNVKETLRFSTETAQVLVDSTPNLLSMAPMLNSGAKVSETVITRIVDDFSKNNNHIFENDFDAVVASVSQVINPSQVKYMGGTSYSQGSTLDDETQRMGAIQDNQNAIDNGIITSIEMAKLAVGYTDANDKYHAPLAVLGGALDIVTGVNNFIDSIKGASDLLTGHKRLVDNTAGWTREGHKFKGKEYDGITIDEYLQYGLNPPDALKEQLGDMYRYKALQIHLTFQLAIAMQGFQGGKAVSDADFDRAWMLLTNNTGKTIFGRMTSAQGAREGLQVVTEQFARMAIWNKAYLESRDGTRKATANTVLAIYDQKAQQEGVELGKYSLDTIYKKYSDKINFDDLYNLENDVNEEEGNYFNAEDFESAI